MTHKELETRIRRVATHLNGAADDAQVGEDIDHIRLHLKAIQGDLQRILDETR